jgi:hypothetical protein
MGDGVAPDFDTPLGNRVPIVDNVVVVESEVEAMLHEQMPAEVLPSENLNFTDGQPDLSMWKECGDDTGKVYFWNREDNTTSWAPPAGWETRAVSVDEEELGEEGEGDEGEDEEEMDSKGNARLN